jgi:arsenate reductase (thioredoxin)
VTAGFESVTVAAEADDHKAYYPGSHRIAMRWTVDRPTRRVLGVQLFGHRHAEVAKRIDIVAAALFNEMTVDAMSDLDLSYTPPLGSPWEAVQMGAQAWVRAVGEPPNLASSHEQPSTGASAMTQPDRRGLDNARKALTREFAGIFSPETVAACLDESYAGLAAAARIDTFLTLFAERFARERLQASAKVEGKTVTAVPEVLFVCVHNAGRSQMAAALLDHRAQATVHVRSAGSDPSDRLNQAVVEAMSELGLDITKEFPKLLTDEVVKAADVVITMGCGDACPLYPGKRYLDWDLEDPAEKSLATVRRIRDEVDERVQALLAELVPANAHR